MVMGLAACGGSAGSGSADTAAPAESTAAEAGDTAEAATGEFNPDTDPSSTTIEEIREKLGEEVPVKAGYNLAAIEKSISNEFWRTLQEGYEKAAENVNAVAEINIEVDATTDEGDETGQQTMVENAVNQGVSAIMASPISDANLTTAVENAQDANIPVINVNDGLIAIADYYCGPNAYQNGLLAAEWVSNKLGDEGRKIAVFAIMSDTRKTYSFLLAIMMWQTMNLLCDKALAEHGGSLPVPVTFLFDEFANIGKIPDIESMAAVVRSRNMSISVVLQSIAQLKANYSEETAQTIVDCCDTTLFLGGKSNETNREISEMAGKETVSILTFNESRGTMNSSTRNWNVVERDLIQSAEVGKMPRDEAIVLIAGTDPLCDRKYDIERHPRWKEVHPGHDGAICEPYEPGKSEEQ